MLQRPPDGASKNANCSQGRGDRSPPPTPRHVPGPLLRGLLRAPARLYDWHLGWLLGNRFLRLTHLGRRSGRTYQTMLEVVGTCPGTDEVIVMAGLGSTADWYRNVQARPTLEVAIGRRRFPATWRRLDEGEAVKVLASYEGGHRLAASVIRRVLSWLVGWQYDGSAAARSRLVSQLPVVAFRPADAA